MSEDPETIGLRPMVVDGVVQVDDYEVVWRGLSIGRILKQPHTRHWWWGCNVYGQNPTPGDRGVAIDFRDGQDQTDTDGAGHCDCGPARRKARPTKAVREAAARSVAPGSGQPARSTAPACAEVRHHRVQWRRHRLRRTKHLRHGRSARRGKSTRHSIGVQSAPVWNANASTLSSGLAQRKANWCCI